MGGYKRAHHAAVYPPTQEPDQHIPARRLTDPLALLLARAKLLSPVLVRHHCAGRPLFPVRLFWREENPSSFAPVGLLMEKLRLVRVHVSSPYAPPAGSVPGTRWWSTAAAGHGRGAQASRFRYSYPAAVFNKTEQLGRMAPEESNALHEFREDALVGVVKDLIFFLNNLRAGL